jgi:7-keto-8-aminopelargonate synthetase-like enzyme
MVDDAHASGVLGKNGRGTPDHFGLTKRVQLQIGTLSKAFGGQGGFVAGSEELVEHVRSRSRAYLCASPIPPAAAQAGLAALKVLEREPERLARLRAHERAIRSCLERLGVALGPLHFPAFAFTVDRARELPAFEQNVRAAGLYLPWIRYPDGPTDGYFRITVSAGHTPADVTRLCETLTHDLPSLEPRALAPA